MTHIEQLLVFADSFEAKCFCNAGLPDAELLHYKKVCFRALKMKKPLKNWTHFENTFPTDRILLY